MTENSTPQNTPDIKVTAELRDIQGGAIGFFKDHERLLFISFAM